MAWTSGSLDGKPCWGTVVPGCSGTIRLESERFDERDRIYCGRLRCDSCHNEYLDSVREERMAQKRSKGKPKSAKPKAKRKRPRPAALPGMEDHGIQPLDDVAQRYAEIRDERMELTKEEIELKAQARKLMHKYEKNIYRHNGIEIRLVQGEEDVKVKVRKVEDAADSSEPAPAEV